MPMIVPIGPGLSPLGLTGGWGQGGSGDGSAGRLEACMGVFETCGNSYDKTFTIKREPETTCP
jgi:hypothetical protein